MRNLGGQSRSILARSTGPRTHGMRLFSSSLFRRKDVSHLISEMNSGERLDRRLGPVALDGAGNRGHDRHRALCANRLRRQGVCRPVAHALVPDRRRRLRICRALLFRAREHGAGGRKCLYLRLYDAGRAGGLDHRLGLDPRVCDRVERGRRGLVEPSRGVLAKRVSHPTRPAIDLGAVGFRHRKRKVLSARP